MTRTRTRITRLVVAVVFVLPVILSALTFSSLAAPSEEEVQAAKDKLAGLQHEFEVLAEQYNDAKYRLALIERKLAESREQRDDAERQAQRAEGRLAQRAVQAYVGTGSQVDGLLGAESIAEFSDRLEFMGAVAEGDAEIARAASNARQEAEWAADRFADTLSQRQQQVAAIENQLDRLDSMIDEQASLYEELNQDRQEYLAVVAAQQAALEQARARTRRRTRRPPTPRPTRGATSRRSTGRPHRSPCSRAMDMIGTQYVLGSADPSRLRLLRSHLVGLGAGGRVHPAFLRCPVLLAPACAARQRAAR